MVKLTVAWQSNASEIAVELNMVKDKLARLGLYRTMHKVDNATKQLGWEISDILTGKQKNVTKTRKL